MSEIELVTVKKKANVYFDGKCVSHTILTKSGEKKSVGVIFPSVLTFNTASAELMEIIAGSCRVKIIGNEYFQEYREGDSFKVGENSSFEIETREVLHYVCHFMEN